MSVPNALPTCVPTGKYLCRVISDPVQKASRFAEGKFYLEVALQIQNEKGNWFEFPLATTIKNPRYHEILQVCGGRILMNGITEGPETLVGRQFVAKIIERPSRDGKRQVNEITEVFPFAPKKKTAQPAEETEETPVETEPIVSDEGDVIPF